MTAYWFGFASGFATLACLGILTTIAIRSAERGQPMAVGHWPHDDAEDDIDRELRNFTKDAA